MKTSFLSLACLVLVATSAAAAAQCELQTLAPPHADLGFGREVEQDGAVIAIRSARTVHFFRQVGLHAYHEEELLLPGTDALGEMELDGDTLAFSMHGMFGPGEIRILERGKGGWIETFRFAPTFAGGLDPVFGRSLALDGDRLAVGCPGEHLGTIEHVGAVYVFERAAGVWRLVEKLFPLEPQRLESFGLALDLEGDRMAVGAHQAFNVLPKRAFVFERDSAGWVQSDLLAPRQATYGYFGLKLDLRGDRLLLCDTDAASGELARLFEFDGARWSLAATLSTPNAVASAALPFGAVAVALSGDGTRAVVGAAWDDKRGRDAGAAFVFEERSGIWSESEKLYPEAPFVRQGFGADVSCSGDLAVVTTPGVQRALTLALDGGCRTLTAHPEEISLASGGRQTLRLNPGRELAGKPFLLLGSARGTDPGIRLRGARVPLLPDWYFWSAMPGHRRAPFANNLGVLRGGAPQAIVTIDVPPGMDGALAGLVLHHAFVVLDGGVVKHVSNAETLTLVP